MHYLDKLQELVTRLEEHRAIRLEKVQLGDGIEDWQLEILYEAHKVTLDEDVLSLYREVNGVEIVWVLNLDEHGIMRRQQDSDVNELFGRIEIRQLEDMLYYDKYLDNPSWSGMMAEEERIDLKNFRYIDYNDDDVRVGFVIDNGEIRNELLYLLRDSNGFGYLNCTLDYYVEALIQAKGLQGWQQTFIFRESEQLRSESNLSFYMPQLFPEEDLQNFK
jgi:hypothetical protein